ncbi:hypothetical protein CLV55_105102 [Flavobacterium aciduliphilum]|uniref:Uncharacterized protein n=1 Tax=Flavobacterium aciduliphilum TaxID=1101402 RepID=A0A328YGV5_9FLAO|nr:hypothetical protein CLV55_105102 [Flavobacterium aciduliphilum]
MLLVLDKSKKAIHKSGKLFIGLTTKPICYELQIRSETTQLILNDSNHIRRMHFICFLGKKGFHC